MRRRFASVLITCGLAAPAWATTPVDIGPSLLTTSLDGMATVDPDGTIESYRVTTNVPESMATKVDAMVRKLRLAPLPAVDGKAPLHARMRITLAGLPQDDDSLETRLENVWFPDDPSQQKEGHTDRAGVHFTLNHRSIPQYPYRGAVSNTDANVLVVVKFGRDGRVADAVVRQSALLVTGGDPAAIGIVLADFEEASLKAVRKWRVKVDVDAGVQPTDEQMTVLAPFYFSMTGHARPQPGEWRWEVRSQKRETPWLQRKPGTPLVGVSDVEGSELMAGVQSPLQLAAPIEDQAL